MPPAFIPAAGANVFAHQPQYQPIQQLPYPIVNHYQPFVQPTKTEPQRLPNEILLRIITYRIEEDLSRLLLEAPSDYTMWSVAHFSSADTLVTEKRIAFRRNNLSRNLRNLARVSTFCMDTVQRVAANLRPYIEARYWKVFDNVLSIRDRPQTYLMFSNSPTTSAGAGCCKFHVHRQLLVKSHEEAVSVLYAIARLIADLKDDGTRPCIDALLREVKRRSKSPKNIEVQLHWAAKWMGISFGYDRWRVM